MEKMPQKISEDTDVTNAPIQDATIERILKVFHNEFSLKSTEIEALRKSEISLFKVIWDSLDLINMSMVLEEEFGIQTELDELIKSQRGKNGLQDLVNGIDALLIKE